MMILGVVGMRKEALLMMAGLGGFTFPLIIKGIWGVNGGILVPVGGMILIAAWLWVLIVGGDVKIEESE